LDEYSEGVQKMKTTKTNLIETDESLYIEYQAPKLFLTHSFKEK